ncbi:MAG TPA: electron transport complex subunit E [Thermoanaerobaculia bacterium]|nr:electron transport complex subunit E [Thermoanaerobaculia bacterium]
MPDPITPSAELLKGLWRENPVFVQVLGMCPALAVTNSAVNGLAMGLATTFVVVMSSLLVSSVRRWVPKQVRISTYILIIATFVTVADFALQAWTPALHRELGAFVALIVVNCLILGRQEAFASRHSVVPAVADAAGMGAGFTLALVMLGSVREVLGMGSWFGLSLFGPRFEPWVVMILPPGGFLMMGVLLLLFACVADARRRAGGRLYGGREAA